MEITNICVKFINDPVMGLSGYLYNIVTGKCHSPHTIPINIEAFKKPRFFNSLNKKPLQATSSISAEIDAIVNPRSIFIKKELSGKTIIPNIYLLAKNIIIASIIGISIEGIIQKLNLKGKPKQFINF
jgi:hypothetical protein